MFYQRLKDLREDMDMNQTKIANIIGTSQSYYAQYENGNRTIPFDRVVILAEFYDVSIDYIAGRTNDKKGFNKSDLPPSEVDLLKKFRNLSDKQRGIIIGRIEAFTDENEEQAAQTKGAI